MILKDDERTVDYRPAILVYHKISINDKENQYFQGKNLYD